MSKDRLSEHRKKASDLSLGLSDSAIYQKFLEVIQREQFSGRVLDFGAGQGELTKKLYDLDVFDEVHAVDLMARPSDVNSEVSWRQADLNEEIKDWTDYFDVILAAEVIEHLENPRLVARQIFSWLKPGGVVVLSTPNNESFRSILSLVFRGHFVDFTGPSYPAHITPLVTMDLKRVLSEAGFIDPGLIFTDSGAIPKFPRYKWQQLFGKSLKGLRFSDNVLVKASKPKN